MQAKDPAAAMFEESRPEVDSTGTDGDDGVGTGRAGTIGGDARDIEAVRSNGGRGIFYVESRPTQVNPYRSVETIPWTRNKSWFECG